MSYFSELGMMITSPFGPGIPAPLLPQINMPVSLFPTSVKIGEPVMISGGIATAPGTFGAQIEVKFDGAGWQGATLLGPGNATVTVPPGARTGPCEVRIDGQTRWAGKCFIEEGRKSMGYYSDLGLIASSTATPLQQIQSVPQMSLETAVMFNQSPGYYPPESDAKLAERAAMQAAQKAKDEALAKAKADCAASGKTWVNQLSRCDESNAQQDLDKLTADLLTEQDPVKRQQKEEFLQYQCIKAGGSYLNQQCYVTRERPDAQKKSSLLPILLAAGAAAAFFFLRGKK